MADQKWKLFEQAVAAFLKSLLPGATVTANALRPDADTGRPRQRDVWIEASVGGLIPIAILVSCKRYKRKMDQQQMDAFLGELRSAKAHIGVVYSYSGFTAPAIKKARANQVSCCRLYANEPPDIPQILLFASYWWQPVVHAAVVEGLRPPAGLKWQDLFEYRDDDGPLLDQIEHAWQVAADGAKKAIEDGSAKPNLHSIVNLTIAAHGNTPAFKVQLVHRWRLFRARETAYSVSGSWSDSDRRFIGSVTSPSIDTWSSEPGPGWEELPTSHVIKGSHVNLVSVRPAVRQALIDHLGPSQVFLPEASATG